MRRRILILLLFVSLPSFAGGAKQPKPTKNFDAFLEKLQSAWNKTSAYKAEFKQTIASKTMGTTEVTEGKIYVSKPGKFRWEGQTSIQIMNGKKLIQIQPKAQRGRDVVDIYRDASKKIDTSFLRILSGNLSLKTQYKVSQGSKTKQAIEITLKPKKSGTSFVAKIDRKRYVLLSLSFDSEDTETSMEFSDIIKNPKLKSTLFEYKKGKNSKDIVHIQ